MTTPLHFYLNDQEIVATEPRETSVLDLLRNTQRLTGTKEGCREGDCGACVVLVGELGDDHIHYKAVTSCLMPIGQLRGKHLVTIEGLNQEDLSPVQQAIVDEGASQCGFCTPGIVVSLTGYLLEHDQPVTIDGVKTALGGHLCRCTGYRSLKAVANHLQEAQSGENGVGPHVRSGLLPAYFERMPERLRSMVRNASPNGQTSADVYIAGGTDVYVQTDGDFADKRVAVLHGLPEMEGIIETDGAIDVGALTTFEDFGQHPAVIGMIPDIQAYMFLIASLQIRNRATLGGNVINASPIGDMTILFLALRAELSLSNGTSSRTVPLPSFYHGYKELDKSPDEVLTRIRIPRPTANTRINWEKVSKRKCLDIASVNSAITIRVDDDRIVEASLAMGGVAPIPKLLSETCDYLVGKSVSAETVLGAVAVTQREISPISDIRGTATYKRLLARQMILAHFVRLYPEHIRLHELYEAR